MDHAKDGPRTHALLLGGATIIAALVVFSAWLGPTGCQRSSPDALTERPARPRSPLDEVVDRRGSAEGTAAATAQVPEPPEERPVPPTSEPLVRIRVAALRGPAAEFSVPRGGLTLREDGSTVEERLGSPLKITNDGREWTIVEGSGSGTRERRTGSLKPLAIRASTTDAAGEPIPLVFGGSAWPGSVRLHARNDPPNGIDVVMSVGLERYLPGVLAKELYRSWALETYRAQAIAARSYAVCEAAHWSRRRHFDMVAGEASQAWIGETDNTNAKRAVADTRGIVLVEDGRVVPAYYSSCCGGSAADAIEAVTRNPNHDIPSLALGREDAGRRPSCCTQSPTYSWTERLPVDEVARRLSAWGRENGRSDLASIRGLSSISVSSVNAAGRTRSVLVVDGTGARIDLPAETLRFAMNGAPADPGRSASAEFAPRRTLKSSNVEISIEGGTVIFNGRGHGHGVGLCQYGTEAMARAGRSWNDMLSRYYPGATAERRW